MELLIFILLIFLLAIAVSLVVWSLKNGISPMPTTPKVKSALFTLLPTDLKGTIYELGSGWGTLVFPLAKKFPSCQVVGLETSPVPFIISYLFLKILSISNAKLFRRDFFTVDLSEASLVVCYLYPEAMRKLKKKLEVELKPGCLVVSNTFAIPGWTYEKIIEIEDIYHTKVYLYKV